MKTAIIFGANGQDGHYLHELLGRRGVNVIGTSRSGNWLHIDVANYKDVKGIIRLYKPDYIFHLAANSTTHHDAHFENHATISTGALNILESVKIFSPHTKIFLSGSGLQFKSSGHPIKETDPFEASSLYAVSRIQSVYAARYYRSIGLQIYIGYFFNHESPIRPERHMSKKIACAVQRIANGSEEKIKIGDISVRKEWTFAGDIVKGIVTLVDQNAVHEALIASGLAYSIEEWLQECFNLIHKDWKEYTIEQKDFISEYRILVANPKTIFSLGWKPEVSFSSLAEMMVKHKAN